jgi:hypothetical protein
MIDQLFYVATLIPSCYIIDANKEFTRFDSYGMITNVQTIQGNWSAGKGKPAYDFPNNALIIRGPLDVPPTALTHENQELPNPIMGSFELGINELGDDLVDNYGQLKICFKRKH